jgi:hypothetical protein
MLTPSGVDVSNASTVLVDVPPVYTVDPEIADVLSVVVATIGPSDTPKPGTPVPGDSPPVSAVSLAHGVSAGLAVAGVTTVNPAAVSP